MKRHKGHFLRRIIRMMLIVLAAMTVLFGWRPVIRLFRDVTGEIRIQSAVLKQKLESSKRLEVMTVDEEGILNAETSVIILGTVGSTTIRYRYTASLGIDLGKVIMTTESDRIIFLIPDAEILNDGIEALEINRHNFFSKAIEKSAETLLSEQRILCREQYLKENIHTEKTWDNTVKALEETICSWLDPYGERHYQFEFYRAGNMQAE